MIKFFENQTRYEMFYFIFFSMLLLLSAAIVTNMKKEKWKISKRVYSNIIYGFGLLNLAIACLIFNFSASLAVNASLVMISVFIVDSLLIKEGKLTKFNNAEIIYPEDLSETNQTLKCYELKLRYQVDSLAIVRSILMSTRNASISFEARHQLLELSCQHYFMRLNQPYNLRCNRLVEFDESSIKDILQRDYVCYNDSIVRMLIEGEPVETTVNGNSVWIIAINGFEYATLLYISIQQANHSPILVDLITLQYIGNEVFS